MTDHPDTIAILRLISAAGVITTRELEAAMPQTGAVTRHLWTLKTRLLIDSDPVPCKTTNHSITAKGRRLLQKIDGAGLGDFPAPRQSTMSGTLTGTRWNIRENADQHKDCPSRRGDAYEAWAPPILIAGKPEQRV